MGKLIVVRHGETDYNVEGKYAGSTNIPINEKGIVQAKETAEKLKNLSIDIIYSSTLIRARQTADIINEIFNLPIIESTDLVEINMGVYEGLTRKEAQVKYPDMWRENKPEGREPFEKVKERVFRVLEYIKNNYNDKTVLIVTHGYVTKVIYKYFKNPTEEEFRAYSLGNCEFTTYDL